jgi:hypothetical protein
MLNLNVINVKKESTTLQLCDIDNFIMIYFLIKCEQLFA